MKVGDGEVRVVREGEIAGLSVFVDGLPGCGKTLLTAIVGALDRVELMQYVYEIEYACVLRFLGRTTEDAATTTIRMFADLRLYNVMQGRETNFRWTDLSGVRRSAHRWRYLRRLFLPGDEAAVERIRRERPILHMVTHLMLGVCAPLFTALGDRTRVIEVVRHPLYMIKQQFAFAQRWASDPRELSIWFEYDGRVVPWFARGWEEQFLESGPMDRAIFMTEHMQQMIQKTMVELGEPGRQVMVVPFERFVTDPWPFMGHLERFLGTQVTRVTRRMMRAQRVPRRMYAEGIDRPIYRQYGWEPPQASDEAAEFQKRRAFAAQYASPRGMEVLDQLCRQYEEEYLPK